MSEILTRLALIVQLPSTRAREKCLCKRRGELEKESAGFHPSIAQEASYRLRECRDGTALNEPDRHSLCPLCELDRTAALTHTHTQWDHTTSIEEMMDSLDVLVKQGKVLYLGISNAPAWVIAACNTYAKAQGQAQFVILQTKWNVLE